MTSAWLPAELADLFERPLIGVLATIDPSGEPHQTAVWVDYSNEGPLINTLADRAKDRHMLAKPDVALTIVDPANPYRVITINGTAQLDTDTAIATQHIDNLAQKYLGADRYPRHDPHRPRRLWTITPQRTTTLTEPDQIR